MATAEANYPIRISAPAGDTIPLFAGAVAKVFLSGDHSDRIKQLVQEKELPSTIVDEGKSLAEL